MGLMSYIHNQLLKRGKLSNLLPDADDLDDTSEREAARVEIQVRVAQEREVRREVRKAIAKLHALNEANHYGESLRRAFGGR